MMSINDDSILLFEYFTASGEKDKCIISEAEALIFSLLDDLKDYDVTVVLNESYKEIMEDYDNVTPIFINEDIIVWLEKNAASFKKAIFIAAENNNNLYNITKILEENNVKIYNSSSEACYNSSDKFVSYELLYNIVPQPRTFKLKIDKVGYWKRALENLYKKWHAEKPLDDLKLIIKPLVGVDCENIKIINGIDDLDYSLEKIFLPGSRVIVQEFIEGTDISVSLLCDGSTAIPISLNKQIIDLTGDKGTYLGGEIPFESKFKDLAFRTAIKAVESMDGLKGFVGVDLVISNDEKDIEDIYVLEINSRFTTPYAGLKKIANVNIGSSIIDLIDKNVNIEDLNEKIDLNGKIEFKKSGDNLVIRRYLIMKVAGFDIGGANTDLAVVDFENNEVKNIEVDFAYLPMWSNNEALPKVLTELIENICPIDEIDAVGISMTAELVDAYDTKKDGVLDVVKKCEETFECPTAYVGIDGMLSKEEIEKTPLKAAAANWIATAQIATLISDNCIFIDTGSTTTDIIPIKDGKECAIGRSDFERLATGELVYTGTLRTNLASFLDKVQLHGKEYRVASELFAQTADVYTVLDLITLDDYVCDTFDGENKSKKSCMKRIARVLCADLDSLSEADVVELANFTHQKQVEQIADALKQVSETQNLNLIVTTGLGKDILDKKAAEFLGLEVKSMDTILTDEECVVAPAVGTAVMMNRFLN